MARWKIDAEREFHLSGTGEKIWSSQQPPVMNSLVLIACEEDVLYFNLESYSLVKKLGYR